MKLFGGNSKGTHETVSRDIRELLDLLDVGSLIVAPGEIPLYVSPGAIKLGIVRDGRITSEELISILRNVRRTQISQEGAIEIALGPIGQGTRKLSVKVSPCRVGKIIVFIHDESEAERIDEVRRDFVTNVSHELKTPISALRTLSEAVKESATEPQQKKFAELMQSETERLSHLVQEIINLSRLQDSDPLMAANSIDIDEIVNEAIDQCRTLASARQIEIFRGPASGAKVIGDRNYLISAVDNLIENAINYSPEKTKVTVNTDIAGELVEISVIDQGIGIAESDLGRIFERFYRVDPARSRQTGGTGLGLSIVKNVAMKHGGDVTVWSSQGTGSTFCLKLPLERRTESGV